jgi:hypothetical protein
MGMNDVNPVGQNFSVELTFVHEALCSFGAVLRAEAMEAIWVIAERARQSAAFISEDTSWLNVDSQGRIKVFYELRTALLVVIDIQIDQPPIMDSAGAFLVRRDGWIRAFRIPNSFGEPQALLKITDVDTTSLDVALCFSALEDNALDWEMFSDSLGAGMFLRLSTTPSGVHSHMEISSLFGSTEDRHQQACPKVLTGRRGQLVVSKSLLEPLRAACRPRQAMVTQISHSAPDAACNPSLRKRESRFSPQFCRCCTATLQERLSIWGGG